MPMSPYPHHLDIRDATDRDGRHVLVLSGDVDLQTADQLRDAVDEAATTDTTVIIDLEAVRFMDSPGLGTLIFCHQRLAGQDVTLIVRGPRGHVRELFDLVQLDTLVSIEPSP
jgi:anti-sigma B factor antagonist